MVTCKEKEEIKRKKERKKEMVTCKEKEEIKRKKERKKERKNGDL